MTAGPPTCRSIPNSASTVATARCVRKASSMNSSSVPCQKMGRSGSFHTSKRVAGSGAVARARTTSPTTCSQASRSAGGIRLRLQSEQSGSHSGMYASSTNGSASMAQMAATRSSSGSTTSSPTPLGERSSKVLVTNLANRVLPIIRYEITDEVTLAPPEPRAPWKGQRLLAIHGRQDDIFDYGSQRVHPHTFRSVLSRYADVTEYQVRQTTHGADVSVLAHSPLDAGRLEASLTAALTDAGLTDPRVRVENTTAIERHPRSHKLKRFLPM